MKKIVICVFIALLCFPSCNNKKTQQQVEAKDSKKMTDTITTSSGLQYIDETVGTGNSPRKGEQVVVHYTGWLDDNGKKGKKFDSSVDRNEPYVFPIGMGKVIGGWDEGVMSMKVGGKRTLIIPSKLGYGAQGAGGDIPPNATLIFDVELLDIK